MCCKKCFAAERCFLSFDFTSHPSWMICRRLTTPMRWSAMSWWMVAIRSWWWRVTGTTSSHHCAVPSSRQWRCSTSCTPKRAKALCTRATVVMPTSTPAITALCVMYVPWLLPQLFAFFVHIRIESISVRWRASSKVWTEAVDNKKCGQRKTVEGKYKNGTKQWTETKYTLQNYWKTFYNTKILSLCPLYCCN